MTTSPRGADELVSGQAIPETTVNEIVRHTEAGACHFPVVDKDLTSPPGSCTDGANYIIAATASGLWTGKEKQVATALGTNAANGWRYHTPIEGFTAYMQDENARYLYGGSSWALDTTGGSFTTEDAQDAVGAMVDGTLTYTDATPLLRVTQETKASDIASAGTTNIGALVGGFAHVTGTTTITAFDTATAGLERTLKFDGILILTHNATSLILPTAANITTAAGDTAIFRSEGSGNWRCVAYNRTNGQALAAGAVSLTLASTVTQSGTPVATSVGFLGAPQMSDQDDYTLALTDAGGHYYHVSGTPHTLTIPANGSIAFPIGTVIAIVNENGGGNLTIAITSDTLRWGSSTGSRTLAANGSATLLKVTSTVWRLTGDGIT